MSSGFTERRSGVPAGRQANGLVCDQSAASTSGRTSSPCRRCWALPAAGRPNSQPCPSRAPSARAMARCRSSSMPSASTAAPLRSAYALTAFMISAMAGPGRCCTSRRSSLMTSGRSSGMKARDRSSAPMSSSAIFQPSERTRSTVRRSSAGRAASARSVISRTTWMRSDEPCAMASRSSSGATSSTSGSTLTNTDNGATTSCSTAARSAARRHSSSSSPRRPTRRAAANSRSGRSSGPCGPRARASYATTAPLSRSTMGCRTLRTSPLARTTSIVVKHRSSVDGASMPREPHRPKRPPAEGRWGSGASASARRRAREPSCYGDACSAIAAGRTCPGGGIGRRASLRC
jgi:hypothetical protein